MESWTGPMSIRCRFRIRGPLTGIETAANIKNTKIKFKFILSLLCYGVISSEYSVSQYKPGYLRNGLSVATRIGFIDKSQSMMTLSPSHHRYHSLSQILFSANPHYQKLMKMLYVSFMSTWHYQGSWSRSRNS